MTCPLVGTLVYSRPARFLRGGLTTPIWFLYKSLPPTATKVSLESNTLELLSILKLGLLAPAGIGIILPPPVLLFNIFSMSCMASLCYWCVSFNRWRISASAISRRLACFSCLLIMRASETASYSLCLRFSSIFLFFESSIRSKPSLASS